MPELKILNTREIKQVKELVKEDFGFFPEGNYAFLRNNQDRIYLVNTDLEKLNLKNLIIDKFGLYFGELKDHKFRLGKEGTQLLFQKAKEDKVQLKNILELNPEEVKAYFRGQDLDKDLGIENKPVILTFNSQCLGAARYKDQKILNFLPKIHRGEVIL